MNHVVKSLKPIGVLLALAVIGAGVSGAQTTGESVTKKFKLQDLLEKRGQIQIGVNVPTSIEFDEPIAEHIIGRDDLLIDGLSKAKPNRVYFRAKEAKGSSSIDITLEGGATALFTFTINPKITEGLRYVVQGKSEGNDGGDAEAGKPAEPKPAPQSAKPKPVAQNTSSGVPGTTGTTSKPSVPPQQQAAVPSQVPAVVESPAGGGTSQSAPGTTGTMINLLPEVAPTTPSPASVAEVAPATIAIPAANPRLANAPVPLSQTINAIRHYDPKVERPGDLTVNFNERHANSQQLEFELAIENRGTQTVNFDPGSMNVYVYGNTSPTNPRLKLYLTLAPKFALRDQIEVAPGGVLSRRFVMSAELDRKQMFEYVADFALVHEEATVQYRRSVYR